MNARRLKWVLVSAAVLVAAAAIAWPRLQASRPSYKGFVIEPPVPAPDFTLTNHHGRPFRLSENRADVTLLFFGYTFCPDVCPGTLAELRQVMKALGPAADRVQVLMVSVDPERDTPARMEQYLSLFNPEAWNFVGLTGSPDAVQPVVAAYGAVARKEPIPGSSANYLVAHSTFIYVLDRHGLMHAKLVYGMGPEAVLNDVRVTLGRAQ